MTNGKKRAFTLIELLVVMATLGPMVRAPLIALEGAINVPGPAKEKLSDTHFTFEKRGKLISRPPGMPTPGPYYPTLVKMEQVSRFPYDYALYFSTDHDRGKGGIWLYVCNGSPTDAANWKSYEKSRIKPWSALMGEIGNGATIDRS